MILGYPLLALFGLLGAPLFLVISGVALYGFLTHGRPPADVTGEISKLVQMDTLITIPFFTFAGYLLAESGAPRRLVAVSRALLGWMPGGMAIVALFACAFFTTFTGASGITIVALGGLLLPVLLQQKYPRDIALGLITTSGSRGLIFPPSLPVIVYGYVAGVDITRLYIAGLVPGFIDVGIVALFCVYVGIKYKVPRVRFDGPGALVALWKALPEVLLPILLTIFILTGILKVPEAAAMTALYVLIVEVLIYRDVHPLRDLPRITKESMVLCGAILVIVGASLGLTNFLVDQGIPQLIVEFFRKFITSKVVFLLALNALLLTVGCMMDIFSAIVIVVPLIMPLATDFGVHPIHLAIIFLINLEIGFNTPPVGMNLFISSFRFRQPIMRLYKAVQIYLLLSIVALAVITYVEPLSLFGVPKDQAATPKGGPAATPAKGKATPDTAGKPAAGKSTDGKKPGAGAKSDGLCDEKVPNDPDCDDSAIDKELDKEMESDGGVGGASGAGDGGGSRDGGVGGSGTSG